MEIEDKLAQLKNIHEVEVPPFLMQFIMHRMQKNQERTAPLSWKYAFITCTILIGCLNAIIFFENAFTQQETQINTVVNSLHLSANNQLYND